MSPVLTQQGSRTGSCQTTAAGPCTGDSPLIRIRTTASDLDRGGIWRGFRQLLPLSLLVIVFGVAFGLAAPQAGLNKPGCLLMSATVFAGAAQSTVLDLWGEQVPLMALAITVFAVNARHLLMGSSLYPWLHDLPPARRYGAMLFVSDANGAMSMRALERGEPGLGLLLGGGMALWLAYWYPPENSLAVVGALAGGLLGGAWMERPA